MSKEVSVPAASLDRLMEITLDGTSIARAPQQIEHEREVVCFRRQRDDEIKCFIAEVGKAARIVIAHVDADLVHHGHDVGIRQTGAHASRGHTQCAAAKMGKECC